MAYQVEVTGNVTVGGADDPCGSGGLKMQPLALRCASTYFPAAVSTDTPVAVATSGALGDNWAELPAADYLDKIELLVVRTSAPMRLRIGAAPATTTGTGAAFPIVFSGGETLIWSVDGTAVTTTFLAGSTTAQVAVNALNASAMTAGLAFAPWAVSGSQIKLTGLKTGSQGSASVTSGTAKTTLGFAANPSVLGSGSDIDVYGLYMQEAGRGSATAPSRVQISGSGNVEVFAAGTTA